MRTALRWKRARGTLLELGGSDANGVSAAGIVLKKTAVNQLLLSPFVDLPIYFSWTGVQSMEPQPFDRLALRAIGLMRQGCEPARGVPGGCRCPSLG